MSPRFLVFLLASLFVFPATEVLCAEREFEVPQPVKHLVSLDDTAGTYHFRSCALFSDSAPGVVPAAATLRGYVSHPECAATGTVRQWRTVRVVQAPKVTSRTSVLFIGNSLTYFNDLPRMVEQLSRAADATRSIRAEFVGAGGLTLEHHWNRGDALARIYGEAWDYVVLQEQSGQPILAPEKTAEFVRRFDAAIRESGARTVLFAPWTTRSLRSARPSVERLFASLAGSHGALLAPVGSAWHAAENARRATTLYDRGGNHPTLAGSYLAACVIYSTLRGRSTAGLPHAFAKESSSDPADRLNPGDAAFVQAIAWTTVSGEKPH